MQPAPRGLNTKPASPSSGSLHIRSHRAPSCGISWNLFKPSTCSIDQIIGDRPPCTAKVVLEIIAAMGKKSNTSVKSYHTAVLPYLDWHYTQNPQFCVIALVQWLPLIMVILYGYFIFSKHSSVMTSTECAPLSTQSPAIQPTHTYTIKRQLVQGSSPPILNISSTSKNWPCTSPTTVTGAATCCTFFSYSKISFSFRQMIAIACSQRISHFSTLFSSLSTSKYVIIKFKQLYIYQCMIYSKLEMNMELCIMCIMCIMCIIINWLSQYIN